MVDDQEIVIVLHRCEMLQIGCSSCCNKIFEVFHLFVVIVATKFEMLGLGLQDVASSYYKMLPMLIWVVVVTNSRIFFFCSSPHLLQSDVVTISRIFFVVRPIYCNLIFICCALLVTMLRVIGFFVACLRFDGFFVAFCAAGKRGFGSPRSHALHWILDFFSNQRIIWNGRCCEQT